LLLQRADRRVYSGQLTFDPIAPKLKHAQFALLVAAPVVVAALVANWTAAKGGKHEKVDESPVVLASQSGEPSAVFPPQKWP
jgi:hypothetical protein